MTTQDIGVASCLAKLGRAAISAYQRSTCAHPGLVMPVKPSPRPPYAAVGIHREIFWLVVLAELHAGVDAFIADIELGQAPQCLLHIDRIGPAPDRQSHVSLPMLHFELALGAVHIGNFGDARAKKP